MKFKTNIYISKPAVSTPKNLLGPRFPKQEEIQLSLEYICQIWTCYLSTYIERTADLFQSDTEFPWQKSERVLVSTLLGAIIRYCPDSIGVEEFPVTKPGISKNPKAKKIGDRGRCDLWASIPSVEVGCAPFNFYLEAKWSKSPLNVSLKEYLLSKIGVSKIFRDYGKGIPGRIDQRSWLRWESKREHEHFVIGLLITPLPKTGNDFAEIKKDLADVFEGSHMLYLNAKNEERTMGRKLSRFPTVALILIDEDGEQPGMVGSFTVLGSTARLARKRQAQSEAEAKGSPK